MTGRSGCCIDSGLEHVNRWCGRVFRRPAGPPTLFGVHPGWLPLSPIHPARTKPIIGLAGGIGAGKSAVADVLQEFGAAVINFDRLSHELLADPDVIGELKTWWGGGICRPTGEPDRAAIARIVFADPDELARLEGVLYPRIARRRETLMTAHAQDPGAGAVVLDAPKLFETGLHELCDAVIFVDTGWPVRLQRVRESRGWTESVLRQRENLLNPLDSKRAMSDYVVVNHVSIEDLRVQLQRVYSQILASTT